MTKIAKLIGAILLCNIVGGIGALVTNPNSEWFIQLQKPSFQPPNWLFGPVWSFLYTLMGISFYLLWKNGFASPPSKIARNWFFVQLLLNSFWSFIYFGWHQIGIAALEISLMLVAIIFCAVAFYRVNKIAGLLFIPYIIWVSFATLLNFSLWALN
jgi:tryptophan-rich sensory protein